MKGNQKLTISVNFPDTDPSPMFKSLSGGIRRRGVFKYEFPSTEELQLSYALYGERSQYYEPPNCVVKDGMLVLTLEREYPEESGEEESILQ